MSRHLGVVFLALVLSGSVSKAEIIKEELPPFICNDGAEIALANVCDGLAHCPDSSDEAAKLCHRIICPYSTFRCSYGACVPRNVRCNGFMDCVDGSDEFFCDNDLQCGDRKFQCSSTSECISSSLICNGYKNCADGSDENPEICKDYVCPEHTFQCTYGGCIHQEVVCDGIKDCVDGTDETEDLCAAANCKDRNDCERYACREDEFACESGGQCIAQERLCDGTHQCRDASDEKREICSNRRCAEGYFRCAYGGCIPEINRCNKQPDCHDWSDEDEEMCGTKLPLGACRLPASQPGTYYQTSDCEQCRPGDIVPELTRLDYTCYGDANLEGSSAVYCQDNRWLPGLPVCPNAGNTIKCPVVKSPGATKRCEIMWGPEAGWTSCDHPAPVGTRVSMECHEYYEREKGSSHIICLHDGTWSQNPLSCKPVCGIRTSTTTALIVKGWNVPSDEPLPWHATLYSHENGKWSFFCGGSLIAERVVLTAGHCVWKTEPDTIKVLLASYSSDFKNQNEEAQVHEVEKIKLQYSYQDHEGNYNSDLALIILKKPAVINAFVLPACIDWANRYDISQRAGEIGIVAGMGVTENDTFSATLRLVTAQVISHESCRIKETRDFRKYLTYTSFCAGWANGTGVCNGDSGGGFLLRKPDSDIWEIHGIVSLSPRRLGASLCDPHYYTVFTKVSAYASWIRKVIDSITINDANLPDDSPLPNRDNIQLD